MSYTSGAEVDVSHVLGFCVGSSGGAATAAGTANDSIDCVRLLKGNVNLSGEEDIVN